MPCIKVDKMLNKKVKEAYIIIAFSAVIGIRALLIEALEQRVKRKGLVAACKVTIGIICLYRANTQQFHSKSLTFHMPPRSYCKTNTQQPQ